MNIIMDRFMGRFRGSRLLLGCVGVFALFSASYADSPAICSNSDFACGKNNAVPITINYRQINFRGSDQVTVQYVPSSQDGEMGYTSCRGGTSLKNGDTVITQYTLDDLTKGIGANSVECVRGFVQDFPYDNNYTQPKSLSRCGSSGCNGNPDPITDNLQSGDNSYIFQSVSGENYLLGSLSDHYVFPLYYFNSLFLDLASNNLKPLRYVPGTQRDYSYDVGLNNQSGGLGRLVFTLGSDNQVVGSVSLSDDGSLNYVDGWNSDATIKGFKEVSNSSLTNVSLLTNISPTTSGGYTLNIILACTNPTADQMEPCNTPGVSASECAIQCDAKNLPTS